MSDSTTNWYDPIIAPFDHLGVRQWREWVVRDVRGRVLELGVGTGLNLPRYRAAAMLAAIDPDLGSLQHALARRNGKPITLHQARAEALPFAADSFDAVVATLTFCSVGDPLRGLREAARVLKPGGAFRLVEHVRVDNRVIGGVQDALTPAWKRIAGNCHLNRDTLALVRQAGFQVRGVREHLGGIFIGIDAIK